MALVPPSQHRSCMQPLRNMAYHNKILALALVAILGPLHAAAELMSIRPKMPGGFALVSAEEGISTWPFEVSAPWDSAATAAAAWEIDVEDDEQLARVVQFASGATYGVHVPSLLGKASFEVTVPFNDPSPTHVDLPLGKKPLTVVHTCCSNNGAGEESINIGVIARSDLSATFVTSGANVTAWVTDTSRAPVAPVSGAEVRVYLLTYEGDRRPAPGLKASCYTDADGACTIVLTGFDSVGSPTYQGSLQGAVIMGGQAIIVSSFSSWPPSPVPGSRPKYFTSILLDRLVAEPGSSLQIFGYTRRQDGLKLRSPHGLAALDLTITRTDAVVLALLAEVEVDRVTGGFHALLPVPSDAKAGPYRIIATPAGNLDSAWLATQNFTVPGEPPNDSEPQQDTSWMNPSGLLADKPAYSVGDSAILRTNTTLQPGAVALLIWGNTELLERSHMLPVSSSSLEVPVQLGSECTGGCTALLLVSAPKTSSTLANTKALQLVLNVTEDRALEVYVSSNNGKVAVTVLRSGGPVQGAEVTFVESSRDALAAAPHPLVDLSDTLKLNIPAVFQYARSDMARIVHVAGDEQRRSVRHLLSTTVVAMHGWRSLAHKSPAPAATPPFLDVQTTDESGVAYLDQSVASNAILRVYVVAGSDDALFGSAELDE